MKRFVLLHMGFEPPSPDDMAAWRRWFDSIADRTIENIGFGAAREVTDAGTAELPWGPDSMTGASIIRAEDMDEAEAIAKECPFVAGIRVFEVREG